MGKIIEGNLDMSTEQLAESIRNIVRHVDENIIGRLCNKVGNVVLNNVDVLLKFVSEAGGGNHLEIGTLFGGSAIAVALLKKKLSQRGIVVCIDPLNGYYEKADVSRIPVTPETLFRNIDLFDVGDRILVMKAYSQSCVDFNMFFSTAYIDGNHKNNTPLHDWWCVKDVVSNYVIFDNWDNKYPDVQKACEVARRDFEWTCVYHAGITYVVKRL